MYYIIRIKLIFTFIFLINSCSNCDNRVAHKDDKVKLDSVLIDSIKVSNENQRQITNKKAWDAIKTGDRELYEQASTEFILSNNPKELVFFSLIMAMKYDNPKAYNDIFLIYNDIYKYGAKENEEYFTSFLFFNLSKSKELDSKFGKIGDTIFNTMIIKHSNYYLDKMK